MNVHSTHSPATHHATTEDSEESKSSEKAGVKSAEDSGRSKGSEPATDVKTSAGTGHKASTGEKPDTADSEKNTNKAYSDASPPSTQAETSSASKRPAFKMPTPRPAKKSGANSLFRTMHKPQSGASGTSLPRPTSTDDIKNAGPEDKITLWRGVSGDQLAGIKKHGTAGGVEGANPEVRAPNEDQAKAQAAGYSLPGFSRANRLPEYTNHPSVANQFGRGGHVVAVEVPKKYLTQGSVAEGGWVLHPDAPVNVKGSAQGEPLKGDRWNVNAD